MWEEKRERKICRRENSENTCFFRVQNEAKKRKRKILVHERTGLGVKKTLL